MHDRIVEQQRDSLLLSTDRARLDVDAVFALLRAAHWGASITRPVLDRSIENSVCVGVYEGRRQLAFARAVTDLATYAYLTDVIVEADARGRGIGSWMVQALVDHPDLQGLRRMTLLTRDAQTLYERFGFTAEKPVSTYMERRPRPAGA